MRCLRILSLVAVAAMATMAIGGVGSASGSTILWKSGSPTLTACGTGKTEINPATDTITATAVDPILTSSIATVTCSHSEVKLKAATATNVAPTTHIAGEITSLSFTGCRTLEGPGPCTVEVKNLPYPATIQGTTNGAGGSTLTVNDPAGAGAKVVCGFLMNCTFTTKHAVLSGTNGAPTTFLANEIPLEREGGFCPATAFWDADYKVTSPAGFTVV